MHGQMITKNEHIPLNTSISNFLVQHSTLNLRQNLLFSFSGSYGENISRKSHTPSAIVIGGGFAGIAAANALRNASFEVLHNVVFDLVLMI